MEETFNHSVRYLEESLNHEKKLDMKSLLDTVADASVYLEEFARTMIGTEELHNIEIKRCCAILVAALHSKLLPLSTQENIHGF